ncbi:MAG: hypothetical protein AAGB34_11515 [Planctomycetota bacterium]
MTGSKAKSTKATKAIDKVDQLMEKASQALASTNYFDAEKLSLEALLLARKHSLFERMARICLPLQESRRQKRLEAIDSGRLVRLDQQSDEPRVEAGCYLFEPMLVAADARDLRERADAAKVPVLAIAREPKNQMGLWPIAMIGPITVRTRVRPPANDEPDFAWMQSASEALGDQAISTLDLNRPAEHIVDQILDKLGTVPEHEKLHQQLANYCRQAEQEKLEGAEGKTEEAESDDFDDPSDV